MKVVVVGAGIGGLTAAATLAQRGHAVTILEATGVVGGKAGQRVVGGLTFDTGPSLLTMPHVIRRALASCGLDEDLLDLRPVEPVTRYRFADGSSVDLSADADRSVEALEAWSPGAGAAWREYLRICDGMWQGSEAILEGLPPWPPRRPTADDPTPNPRDGLRVRPHQTLRQFARGVANGDARMQQIIERFATYAGADPRRAPAVLALAGYVEHAFGAWYPGRPGGLHAIPELLAARAQECGAELVLNAPVVGIEASGRRVRAVRTPNERLAADAVVFGGDQRTLVGLLSGAAFSGPVVRKRLARTFGPVVMPEREPSVSGLALLLAVRPEQPTEVHHEIRFCADYDAEFDDLYWHHRLVRDPTLYLSVPSVTARAAEAAAEAGAPGEVPGAAEPRSGGRDLEPWFVLVNAPAGVAPGPVAAYAEQVQERLGLPPGAVVASDIRTPADLAAETGTPDGAIYGDAPHGRLGTLRRPGPLVPGLRGLVRVGGTVHPGGGVPLVMLSGLTAARLIDGNR